MEDLSGGRRNTGGIVHIFGGITALYRYFHSWDIQEAQICSIGRPAVLFWVEIFAVYAQ
jgi:hypothetical protein